MWLSVAAQVVKQAKVEDAAPEAVEACVEGDQDISALEHALAAFIPRAQPKTGEQRVAIPPVSKTGKGRPKGDALPSPSPRRTRGRSRTPPGRKLIKTI